MYTQRLMVLKWKDKKDVLMLSTFHNDNTNKIEDQNTRKIKSIICCDYYNTMVIVFCDYNNTMLTSVTVFYCCIPAFEND